MLRRKTLGLMRYLRIQLNQKDHPTKKVLDVASIQKVVLVYVQGNIPKTKSTKNNDEYVVENVLKIAKEVDVKLVSQTL